MRRSSIGSAGRSSSPRPAALLGPARRCCATSKPVGRRSTAVSGTRVRRPVPGLPADARRRSDGRPGRPVSQSSPGSAGGPGRPRGHTGALRTRRDRGPASWALTDAWTYLTRSCPPNSDRRCCVFILPPGTAKSVTTPLALTDFEDTLFVASPEGTSTRRLLDERLASVGLHPKLAVVSAQRDAILPLVLAGAGASLVPESMALVAEQLGAVIARPEPAGRSGTRLSASGRCPLPCRRTIRRASRAGARPCSLTARSPSVQVGCGHSHDGAGRGMRRREQGRS